MRHGKIGRKFNRDTSHRRAMFRNLVGNLILHEKIETTEAKAKELRRVAEKIISHAVRLGEDLTADVGKLKGDQMATVVAKRVHAQRLVASFVPRKLTKHDSKSGESVEIDVIYKLFHDIAPRFVARALENKGGGYTRIIKMVPRRGDNAQMALIEILPAA